MPGCGLLTLSSFLRQSLHCEPLVAVGQDPVPPNLAFVTKQVAEKPRGEHLKMIYLGGMTLI